MIPVYGINESEMDCNAVFRNLPVARFFGIAGQAALSRQCESADALTRQAAAGIDVHRPIHALVGPLRELHCRLVKWQAE